MRTVRRQKYKHPVATKGEAVYRFVRDQLNLCGALVATSEWMAQFDKPEIWSHYVEEFMSLNLTGRLLSSGRHLKNKHSNSTVFQTEFKSILSDQLPLKKEERERLLRLSIAAVEASLETIPNGTRNAITNWAKGNHPHCYLCGRMLLFKDENESVAQFTIDHVWPRDFGGDSCSENLLPACKDCNNNHKKNYPSWSMTNIQAILLGYEPSENSLKRIPGSSRFAIQHRLVQNVAVERQLTLKEAYLAVGPSVDVRIVDPLEFGHFFNLANHTWSF
jgi:hypothetical protein